nr:MAG TPA: hypothetical protein [Caudoviricetes sp.]
MCLHTSKSDIRLRLTSYADVRLGKPQRVRFPL